MDGVDRKRPLWKNLKERLAMKGIGICGSSSWSLSVSDIVGGEEEAEQHIPANMGQIPVTEQLRPPPCESASGVNLATALAAERHSRSVGPATGAHLTPLKSLMRLFEETEGADGRKTNGNFDGVCCVCMERDRGAAFIPCGHTYCRACSRELWLNRGTCPLCNRAITGVLDIF